LGGEWEDVDRGGKPEVCGIGSVTRLKTPPRSTESSEGTPEDEKKKAHDSKSKQKRGRGWGMPPWDVHKKVPEVGLLDTRRKRDENKFGCRGHSGGRPRDGQECEELRELKRGEGEAAFRLRRQSRKKKKIRES